MLVFVDLAGGAQRLGGSCAGADLRPVRRCAARRRRSAALEALVRRAARAARGRLAARVSRPLRRRPVRRARRDGVRGQRRPRRRARSPAPTDAIAYLFNEELGAVIQVPAAELRRASRSCSPRSGCRITRSRASRSTTTSSCGAPARSSTVRRASSCGASGRSSPIGCRRCATIRSARARRSTPRSIATIPASARS